jgi:hypothetical protein
MSPESHYPYKAPGCQSAHVSLFWFFLSWMVSLIRLGLGLRFGFQGHRNLHQTIIEAPWPEVPPGPEMGGGGVAGGSSRAASELGAHSGCVGLLNRTSASRGWGRAQGGQEVRECEAGRSRA